MSLCSLFRVLERQWKNEYDQRFYVEPQPCLHFCWGKKMQNLVATIVITIDLFASVVIQGVIFSAGIVEGSSSALMSLHSVQWYVLRG